MSQEYSFNLIEKGWLPCLDLSGRPLADELSLRDLFGRVHEISAIRGESPLVTISLHRLLLALLYHTVYLHLRRPFRHPDDWLKMWGQRERGSDRKMFEDYFGRFGDRFDLFHPEQPFYQSRDAAGDTFGKSVSEMIHEVASGNNATLFDHSFDSDGFALSPAQAARRVVAIQSFGLQGLSGIQKKNFRTAPLVDDVVFLAQGDSLFETLLLNLQDYRPKSKHDCPVWARLDLPEWQDVRSADDASGYLSDGLLDYLTWQNRLVWLQPGEAVRWMKMSRGYRLRLDDAETDPMKSYVRKVKDEQPFFEVVRWNEQRALWRDSTTFFSVHVDGTERPPRAFRSLHDLLVQANADVARDLTPYRFSAFGISAKQAGVNFFRHETFPLPLGILRNEDVFGKLKVNLGYAEKVGRKLSLACDIIKKRMYPGEDKSGKAARVAFSENVMRRYWSHLETLFHPMLVRTAQADVTLEDESQRWQVEVNAAVRNAFDEAIAGLGSTAEAYELYVRGSEKLWGNPLKRKTKQAKSASKSGGDEQMQVGKLKQDTRLEQATRFIAYLERLKASDKGAAAMAELRQAVDRVEPFETLPMFKHVARWLNEEGLGYKPYLIQPLCLVASLFALHPENSDGGNMGTHLALLCSPTGKMSAESVERRFNRLLETPFDELRTYLPQVIRLLRSGERPVNWARVLADIEQWDEPMLANEVKRGWAREFWFRVTKK
jgi:CRISPR system Cascade subunit CasA